jgi:hypothetical protein
MGSTAAGVTGGFVVEPHSVALLRKHKAGQAAEQLRAGDQSKDSGLVFTNEVGGPVDPRSLLRVIEVAAKAAGRCRAHRGPHPAALDGWSGALGF